MNKDRDKASQSDPASNYFGHVSSPIRDHIPFSMGCDQHFNIVTTRHREKSFTNEQVKVFLDNVVGFLCINYVIYPIRYWWRPTFSVGPQFGEYAQHEEWQEILFRASKKVRNRKKAEREADDD